MISEPSVEPLSPCPPSGSLPGAADLRPVLGRWGLALRAQGGRPTCSVFAVTGALEVALAARRGRGERMSVEFLNWAAHAATGRRADGGFFSEIWEGYRRFGICPEERLPYRPEYDRDLDPGDEARAAGHSLALPSLRLHWIKEWDVATGLTGEQHGAIRAVLAAGSPVCAGMRWPKEAAWDDGVLRMRSPDAVFDGHSVLLVGYQDELDCPGGGLFTFRDSGTGGGDRRLTYEYALAYVNDAAWIG